MCLENLARLSSFQTNQIFRRPSIPDRSSVGPEGVGVTADRVDPESDWGGGDSIDILDSLNPSLNHFSIQYMPVDSLSVSVDIQKKFNKYCLPCVVIVVHNTRWRILQTQYFM